MCINNPKRFTYTCLIKNKLFTASVKWNVCGLLWSLHLFVAAFEKAAVTIVNMACLGPCFCKILLCAGFHTGDQEP